jgi:integrase
MSQKLTDKVVRTLERPLTGNRIAYDTEVKGFGARITTNGAISFVLNYRRKIDGRERRATIGGFPAWSVAAARERAAELRRAVDSGGDPVGELAAERGAPTVADLCERFLAEHVAKLAPHTRDDHTSVIRNDILPAIGRMKVAAVEFEHVERLHAKITARAPVRANRCHAVAVTMFNLAIKWRMRADNPCRGVRRNREPGRRRYLTADELVRLTKVLAEHRDQQAAAMVRLLLLTGARRGEILAMRWADIDLTEGTWSKPPSSTKQREHHQVPLSAPARQLLADIQGDDDAGPWVFPGRQGNHRTDLKYAWRRILRDADIRDLHLHDLRHSFASQLVSSGASLPLVGALLGHSTPAITARYAHLYHDAQRQAVERVGAAITGKPSAEVMSLKGRRRR